MTAARFCQRVQRRLAAIALADVVVYSRLMEVDEAGTLAALKERRNYPSAGGTCPWRPDHQGNGRRVLIEFGSAVSAVAGALELQRQMAEANAALPAGLGIDLRIGINLGDIIGEGADIYGDGVNIAARLEALAEPGGLCMSGKVHDEVRGKFDIAWEDAGTQQLKNISQLVRVYRVAPGNAGLRARPPLGPPDKPSIAVLPFQNMSGDPEQDYFAHGI